MTKKEFDRLVLFFKTHRDYNHGHATANLHPPMGKKLGLTISFVDIIVNTYKETEFKWKGNRIEKVTPYVERAVPIEQIINGDNIMVQLFHNKEIVPVHYKHVLNIRLWLGFGDDAKKAVYF